jgi:hypothetical protein
MKRIFLTAFVLLIAGAALYAEGTPEAARPATAEPVTVTGKLAVADNGSATITGGAKTYALLYARYAAAGLPVKNGDTITVTGYVVPGPRWSDGKTAFLRVTQAEINGKTYIVLGTGRGSRQGSGRDDDRSCDGDRRGSMGRGPMMGRGQNW